MYYVFCCRFMVKHMKITIRILSDTNGIIQYKVALTASL